MTAEMARLFSWSASVSICLFSSFCGKISKRITFSPVFHYLFLPSGFPFPDILNPDQILHEWHSSYCYWPHLYTPELVYISSQMIRETKPPTGWNQTQTQTIPLPYLVIPRQVMVSFMVDLSTTSPLGANPEILVNRTLNGLCQPQIESPSILCTVEIWGILNNILVGLSSIID